MLVISLGALLILGGVVLMAEQTIFGGRLSGRFRRSSSPLRTLEPREPGGGFGLTAQWPGIHYDRARRATSYCGGSFLRRT